MHCNTQVKLVGSSKATGPMGLELGLNPRHLDCNLLFHLWFHPDASCGVQERMPG